MHAQRQLPVVPAVIALLLVVLLAGASVFTYRAWQASTPTTVVIVRVVVEEPYEPYLEVAQAFTIDLLTVQPSDVRAQVERILDQSTGDFHADFAANADAFVTSVETVGAAAIVETTGLAGESWTDGDAVVLVAATSTRTTAGVEQAPNFMRLRVTVVDTGEGYKIADVEFV